MLRSLAPFVSIPLMLAGCVDPELDPSTTETGTSTSTASTTASTTANTITTEGPVADSSSDGSSGLASSSSDGSTSDTGSSSSGGVVEPPAASDDEYLWVQGPAALEVDDADGLLANDSPARGLSVVASDPASARGGTVSTAPGGGFTYQAPAGFWGVDSFGYTIEDLRGTQSLATVTVHVRPVVAPVAELPTHEAGYTILGKTAAEIPINTNGLLGGDVRTVGDWNGDGIEDLGIVANHTNLYNEGSAGSDNEGPVYIVLGGPYSAAPTLAGLEADVGGFAILPPPSNNGDPASVSSGDFNGDGLRDLAIWSPFYLLQGRGLVLYGDQTTTSFELFGWDYENAGFIITPYNRPFFGIGDFTGDGRDELAFHNCGLIFGADEVTSFVGPTPPAGVGISLTGYQTCGVEPLSDLDGDGLPELLTFVYDFGAEVDGRAYVVWSNPAPTDSTFDALVAAGDGYYLYSANVTGTLGPWRWASGGGDVDGDGRGDILVDTDGALVVVYGKDTTGAQDVEEVYAGVGGFRINTPGVAVGGAARIVGDVNGDGRADLLIVRSELDRAYVLYGGPATERDLPELAGDGLDGFIIDGIGLGTRMRTTSGDWNGDGLADVAFGAADTLAGRGAVHVVYGVRTVQ